MMITIISIDRYIAVLHPFAAESRGAFCRTLLMGPSTSTVCYYAVTVIAVSVFLCCPHFFDYKVIKSNGLTYIGLWLKRSFAYCLVYRTIAHWINAHKEIQQDELLTGQLSGSD